MRIRTWLLALLFAAASTTAAMALSDASVPTKIPTTWGASAPGGNITCPIPIPSQSTPGRASWSTGFPPPTFLPSGAGGVPPFGQDFNGAFCQLSQWTQWQNAGGPIFYDSAFSGSVGGYPEWSVLSNASTVGCFWISQVDNNTSDPDTGGANWLSVCPNTLTVGQPTSGGTAGRVFYDTGTGTGTLGEYPITGTAGSVVLSNGPTISSPTILGTVAGGASYTAPTITSPTITGTVAGGASYTAPTITSPTITGTVGGSATYSTATLSGATLTGTATASGTFNVSGSFQSAGNTMTFPGSAGTLAALNIADQTLAGGANVTSLSDSTGGITVDCGARPLQYITNGGNFTITAPTHDGSCMLLITNNGSAGTISFNGFTTNSNTGEPFDTTSGHKFTVTIWEINGVASYLTKALQ